METKTEKLCPTCGGTYGRKPKTLGNGQFIAVDCRTCVLVYNAPEVKKLLQSMVEEPSD